MHVETDGAVAVAVDGTCRVLVAGHRAPPPKPLIADRQGLKPPDAYCGSRPMRAGLAVDNRWTARFSAATAVLDPRRRRGQEPAAPMHSGHTLRGLLKSGKRGAVRESWRCPPGAGGNHADAEGCTVRQALPAAKGNPMLRRNATLLSFAKRRDAAAVANRFLTGPGRRSYALFIRTDHWCVHRNTGAIASSTAAAGCQPHLFWCAPKCDRAATGRHQRRSPEPARPVARCRGCRRDVDSAPRSSENSSCRVACSASPCRAWYSRRSSRWPSSSSGMTGRRTRTAR